MYIKPEIMIYDANLLKQINVNASSVNVCTAPGSGCTAPNSGVIACTCSNGTQCRCGTGKTTCHGKENNNT